MAMNTTGGGTFNTAFIGTTTPIFNVGGFKYPIKGVTAGYQEGN